MAGVCAWIHRGLGTGGLINMLPMQVSSAVRSRLVHRASTSAQTGDGYKSAEGGPGEGTGTGGGVRANAVRRRTRGGAPEEDTEG